MVSVQTFYNSKLKTYVISYKLIEKESRAPILGYVEV